MRHPALPGFALLLWSHYPKAPFQWIRYLFWRVPKKIFIGLLRFLGFKKPGLQKGIVAAADFYLLPSYPTHVQLKFIDSHASLYQSYYYDGYIPEDGYFSTFQSYGARTPNKYYYSRYIPEDSYFSTFQSHGARARAPDEYYYGRYIPEDRYFSTFQSYGASAPNESDGIWWNLFGWMLYLEGWNLLGKGMVALWRG